MTRQTNLGAQHPNERGSTFFFSRSVFLIIKTPPRHHLKEALHPIPLPQASHSSPDIRTYFRVCVCVCVCVQLRGVRGGVAPLWHRCLVTLTDGDQIVTVADILRTLDFIFQRRVRSGQAEGHRRRATTQINSARGLRPHPFFSWNGNDGNLQLHKKQRCQGATTRLVPWNIYIQLTRIHVGRISCTF